MDESEVISGRQTHSTDSKRKLGASLESSLVMHLYAKIGFKWSAKVFS